MPPALAPSSSAPSEATAASDSSDALDIAALKAELGAAEGSGESAGARTVRLDLYGFADFTYASQLGTNSPILTWYPTFAIGNLNVYVASELPGNWRSLVEVRFLYMPQGQLPISEQFNPDGQRIDTAVRDYADAGRPVSWGGIEIERVYLEHTFSSLLTLRLGQWLTPYGIWNVDHGSPTFIGTFRPYIVGEGLIPERQSGLEAYGSFYVDATKLGYHLTLSNGRGPLDAWQDLDKNKAIGGRIFAQNDSLLGNLTLGASAYYGNYTDRVQNPWRIAAGNALVLDRTVTQRYEEVTVAADLKWEWAQFLLQSEAIAHFSAQHDQLRPASIPLEGRPPGFVPDTARRGVYVLAAYRTPWWNIMPFAMWQLYENPWQISVREVQAGVNVRLTPNVVLKALVAHVWFPSVSEDLDFLTTQAAWSF